MRRSLLIVCAGMLALWVGGCTSEEEVVTTDPSPSPSVAAKSPTATQNFAKPLVSEKNTPKQGGTVGSRIPGLLQSTDPEERARQVQAGINLKRSQTDPFASLPPLVTFRTPAGTSGNTTAPAAGAGTQTARLPQIPSFPQPSRQPGTAQRSAQRSAQRPTPTRSRATASRPLSAPSTSGLKPAPTISALPPLPAPTLAQAVEVSGVIVVGGVAEAILKAPNESTSRYVRAGQRLSNGQILVKRIEVNAGSDPIVILEQNGVEVSRGVGERANPTGTPTARLPQQKFSVS